MLAQTLKHREKLQKKFDEMATVIPHEQKLHLNSVMKTLPLAKQEMFIAELIARHESFNAMTPEEKKADKEATLASIAAYDQILENLDPMQQQILNQ